MGSYEELKHIGFVKLIEVKVLVILSNVYDFFKDNSRSLKETVVSVESKVISTLRPVIEKLWLLCEYKLDFVDDKFDKYAPSFIKNLVNRLDSFIKEKISFAEKVFGPLALKAKTLLEKGLSTIESLLQKCIEVKKSLFKRLVYRAESILEEGLFFAKQVLDKTKVVVVGIPIIGDATQSIIIVRIDMIIQYIETTTNSIKEYGIFGAITSAVEHVLKETQATGASIVQNGFEYVRQALDTTKSFVGGIPIIGEATQSIISKQTDMVSQLIETTTSSIKENGIFGAIASSTEHVVKQAQETSTSIIQKGSESISQALDTAKSIAGSIPFIGDTAQLIITNQTNMASNLFETTSSSIKENGIFGAITSAAEHVVKQAQETSTSIIQKGSESVSQALDTTMSVVGSIPIIGDTTQSIITNQTNMASQLIDSTTSSVKENGIFGAITSAAEHVVKQAQETSTSIIQKGSESVSQALDTTMSVVGSIPIIGDTTQSIITNQTNMASQLIDSTTSSVKENGIFGAITSAAEHVVKQAQETSTSIIQKGSESVSQALDTTMSVVGSIPIIGDTTQSIITNQTNMASQLIDSTTSSVMENGIFGAITSAAEHVVKQAQETSTSIIQKGSESVSQALDTTMSVVGSIPIIGDTTQSIITNQTNMANQLIDSTTSSVKENGIFGAITSATEHVVKQAQETSTSIIQKGSESVSQALDTTMSVVGSIPIIGDTTHSIITNQTNMASQLIDSTTSSVKENGIFGAITSATENFVNEAQATSTSIIQKGFESASQAIDTTQSVVGGIPFIGDTAKSIIAKQTDMASQLIESTTSSINEYGIFGAITSAAELAVKEAQSTSASVIQKGFESASQAIDTTKSVMGGNSIIGDTTQSIISKQTDLASQLIGTATSSIKEHGIFGAITSATDVVVKETQATSASVIQKGFESANQAINTTMSAIGGIPIIGNTAQSIIDKQTNTASQIFETTTSSIKENGIFGAISSVAETVVNEAQATCASMIQKGTDSANQALDTTKYVVGGIPLIGGAAQSIITKQTDMASQLIDTTTSSVKENGIFGAINVATQQVVKEAQVAGESIIQKSTNSASQAVETTKSIVGGIPIVGNAAKSIITKQTDMASKVVKRSTSSVKKHGLFGAIISAADRVVKDAEKTTKTIIKNGSESVNKNLQKTTSVVESILGKKTSDINKKLFSF